MYNYYYILIKKKVSNCRFKPVLCILSWGMSVMIYEQDATSVEVTDTTDATSISKLQVDLQESTESGTNPSFTLIFFMMLTIVTIVIKDVIETF